METTDTKTPTRAPLCSLRGTEWREELARVQEDITDWFKGHNGETLRVEYQDRKSGWYSWGAPALVSTTNNTVIFNGRPQNFLNYEIASSSDSHIRLFTMQSFILITRIALV